MNDLEKMQSVELQTLCSLIETLNKNNLQYFLGYGTLLGAVRHHGFIPWDDDVDIFMPRDDYDRFRNIAEEVLHKPLILTGNVKEKTHRTISIKVRVENPKIQFWTEKNGERVKQNIWIDIFPIDGMPKTRIGRMVIFIRFRVLFMKMRLGRLSRLGYQENKKRSLFEKVIIKINNLVSLGLIFDPDKVIDKFEKIRKKYPYPKSEYVCPLTIDYMEKCICKREWFGDGIMQDFAGLQCRIPENYDAVLKQFYGDYLQLPPEEKRILKHSIILDDNYM